MEISNLPLDPSKPLIFIVEDFANEDFIKRAIHRFYHTIKNANTSFVIQNKYKEDLFKGSMTADLEIDVFEQVERVVPPHNINYGDDYDKVL